MIHHFTYSEDLTLYETWHTEEAEFSADIPDDLYQRWAEAVQAVESVEDEISRLAQEQCPPEPPVEPSEPLPSFPEITGPIPAPRTLAAYQQAQEG